MGFKESTKQIDLIISKLDKKLSDLLYSRDTPKQRAMPLILLFGFIGGAGVFAVGLKMITGNGLLCQINRITGLYCPTCGGTRMVESLLLGDIYQAFRWNPFVFITLPILCVVFAYESYNYICKNKTWNNMDKFLITYVIMLCIFGFLRNLPMLSFLSPIKI